MIPKNFIDLTGRKQHKLTVLFRDGYNKDGSRVMWVCQCECGNQTRISGHEIKRGQKSCKECSKAQPIHFLSHTPEYGVWKNMIRRCTNEKDVSFFRYGARGITVCERWLNCFELFYEDMGQRPDKNYTLERIDNDKGYYPENCKWATRKEQARNFRHNKILEFNGEKHCVSEWAEILGTTHDTIYKRLKGGKTIEQALTGYLYPKATRVNYNGDLLYVKEIERRLGISHGTIKHRINAGKTLEEAISIGKGGGGFKHKNKRKITE